MIGWISTLTRIIGTVSPWTAPLVQIQSELAARKVDARLAKLEDPISALHPDVQDVSAEFYGMIRSADDNRVRPPAEFMAKYDRVVRVLDANKLITGTHGLSQRFLGGIWITNPRYVLYMAALFEDDDKMTFLIKYVDQATGWIDGQTIAAEIQLPVPVVRAVCELFVENGIGLMSRETGVVRYRPLS